MRNYSRFWKGLIHELHCDFSVYEKNTLASIFKWLVAWKRRLPRPKFLFENLSPSSTLSYTITKKPKRVNLRRKSHWGSWSSWGSSLIALSLGFTVIRVLFRFLGDRILFRVLSDRVFFESSDIGSSSSSGSAVIDSSLHQCSFSAMSLFFYQMVFPAGNYMFKVDNRNTTTRCEICWKLTIKIPINFQHISHLVLVFPLITLSRSMPAGLVLFK